MYSKTERKLFSDQELKERDSLIKDMAIGNIIEATIGLFGRLTRSIKSAGSA